jgi:site-specific recombinase XerD
VNRHLNLTELSKSEAERAAEQLRIEIRGGELVTEAPLTAAATVLSFEELGTLYRKTATPRKARVVDEWRSDVEGRLNRVCPFFGQKAAHAVTESDLEAFLAHLRTTGKAASTRNKYLQMFTGLFRWAVRKGYLGVNPISSDSDLRRERHARRSRRLKPGEEEKLLIATQNAPLQRLIVAAWRQRAVEVNC